MNQRIVHSLNKSEEFTIEHLNKYKVMNGVTDRLPFDSCSDWASSDEYGILVFAWSIPSALLIIIIVVLRGTNQLSEMHIVQVSQLLDHAGRSKLFELL